LTLAIFWRGYQQAFGFSKGLDATSPDYDKYWMNMLWANLTVIPILSLAWYGYLSKGCRECRAERAELGAVTSRHESGHIWRLWVMLAAWLLAIFVAGSFQAEQDATWHQVVTRDTAFTPSHIMLFYGSFPAAIGISVGIFLYARTRLPHIFRDRGFPLSFGLVLTGSFFLLFWVAANEFFHSFFFTEEIFSAPLHWGFNIFAYLLAGTFAIWFQTAPRIFELVDKEAEESETQPQPKQQQTAAVPVRV
jgi:methane/ammonia monooxygenase subunit C